MSIKFLTTAMAAKILGFSQDYVRKMCLKGKIKAEKLGYDWVINEKIIKGIKRKRKSKDDHERIDE
jgi:excisionase family DNA binding protein